MRETLPIAGLEDGIIVTADDAWGVWQITPQNFALLSTPERDREAAHLTSFFTDLAGRDCHLLVVPRRVDVDDWQTRQTDKRHAHPAWQGIIAAQAEFASITHADRLWQKRIYLAVRLDKRPDVTLRQQVAAAVGFVDRTVLEDEWELWRSARMQIDAMLSGSPVHASMADVADLAWLYQRAFTRHLPNPVPPLHRERWGAGEVDVLTNADVHRAFRHTRIGDDRNAVYVRWHTVIAFPTHLLPGRETWLHNLDTLDYPVDMSWRFRLMPHTEAADKVKRRRRNLQDQADNLTGTANQLPDRIAEGLDAVDEVAALAARQEPLIIGNPRIGVWADTIDELDRRSNDIARMLRHCEIESAAMGGDQHANFVDALPGMKPPKTSQWASVNYLRWTAVGMAAKSGVRASSTVGDGEGPVIGRAFGATPTLVHYDPLLAARRNLPPGVLISGQLGVGKSVLMKLLLRDAVIGSGAVGMAVDPKNEFGPLADLIPKTVVVKLTDPQYAGVFDPYHVADTPSAGAEMALGVIDLARPGRLSDDDANTVYLACIKAAESPHPSMAAVAHELSAYGERRYREIGESLRSMRRGALGRLLFADAATRRYKPARGLTVMQFDGLDLPDADKPIERWSYTNRLSAAVFEMMGHRIIKTMQALGPSVPKIVAMDEVHTLTAMPSGRLLAPKMVRIARSFNTAVVMASQSSRDFANDQVTGLRASVPARFVFGNADREEAEASVRLLDLDPDMIAPIVQGFADVERQGPGCCIFQDPYGQVAEMRVDVVPFDHLSAFDTTPGEDVEAIA